MKRCPDPKIRLAQVLRKLLEKCDGGELKDTPIYPPGKLKPDPNNVSRLSGHYGHDLKGCSAIITGL